MSGDRDQAPDADDDRKVDSPTGLTRRSWRYVLRRTYREFGDDSPDVRDWVLPGA